MTPEGSRLRDLPAALDRAQRQRIDAVIYATDRIGYCWSKSVDFLASKGREPQGFSQSERIALFGDIWSLVDQADVLRQLMNYPEFRPMLQDDQEVLELLETVRSLRNRMAHIAGGTSNRANKKKQAEVPLHGALSYLFLGPGELDIVNSMARGVVVTLPFGNVYGDGNIGARNPCGVHLAEPVCGLQLSAFDLKLDLDALMRVCERVMQTFVRNVEAGIFAAFARGAAEQGVPVEQLLAGGVGGILILVDFEMPLVSPDP